MAGARTARADSAAGTFSSANGQVQIQRGGAAVAAASGTPIYQGDKIVSGTDGNAVIILTDRSRLELSPSTTITLDQYTTGGVAPTRVSLVSGILRSVVNGSGDAPANYQVHTPNAIVTARGTDFYTAYNTQSLPELGKLAGISQYTEAAVIDGTVNLAQAAAPESGVEVGSGTTGEVAGDEPPHHHRRHFPTPEPTRTPRCRPDEEARGRRDNGERCEPSPEPTRTPHHSHTPHPSHTPDPEHTPHPHSTED